MAFVSGSTIIRLEGLTSHSSKIDVRCLKEIVAQKWLL
jgi:hypothetical protein